ncbi:MAG: hypothetical protein ACXWLM_07215 [Myxococcales bacterium]
MPSSLPAPVVATLPQGPCLDGTSDDGAGNFLLGYTAGTAGSTYANYLFFAIQGGSAVHVADTVPAPGGHGSGTYVYGQPEGFTLFTTWTSPGGSWLDSYSREGVMTHSTAVVPGWDAYPPSSAIGIDPSGGTVIARHEHLAAGWRTTWQRLDAGGAPETAEVTIDTSADPVAAVGVALSGNALVILAPSPGTWRARWFASDGTAIAGWFLIQARDRPLLRSLMDGSLLLGAYHGASIVTYQGIGYMHRVLDGAEELDTLPDWLAQRHDDVFYAVRDGLAYASWGPSGPCGADSVEIVAVSGTSCGCLRVPNLTGSASVGRDGSLIVPRPDASACAYDLYPQLLR